MLIKAFVLESIHSGNCAKPINLRMISVCPIGPFNTVVFNSLNCCNFFYAKTLFLLRNINELTLQQHQIRAIKAKFGINNSYFATGFNQLPG
jgi:hypothetical protein